MNKKTQVITIAVMALCLVALLIFRQKLAKQEDSSAGMSAEASADPEVAVEVKPARSEADELVVDSVLAMVGKTQEPSAQVIVLGSLVTERLHAGQVATGMQLLQQASLIIRGMEDAAAKVASAEKLSGQLVDFEDIEGMEVVQKQLGLLMKQVESEFDLIHPLIANIDTLDGKVRVLAALADALSRAGDPKQAMLIFERAEDIAADIEGAGRLRALIHIASSKIHAGMKEEGAKQFREILVAVAGLGEKTDRLELLEYLAGVFAEFREQEGIQGVINEISEKFRDIRYQDNPSLRLVDRIEDDGDRVQVLCEIAASLAEAGNVDQAKVVLEEAGDMAGTIEDGSSQAPALAHIAVAQAKVGLVAQAELSLKGVAQAMSMIEGIDDRLHALGNIVGVMSSSANEEQMQWALVQSIDISGALQERAAGSVNHAIELVHGFKDGKKRALALRQVVSGLEKVKAFGKLSELQFHLGNLHNQGSYLEKSPQQAAACYLKAARHGHAGAQVALALMHLGGEVVNADIMEAFLLFGQAANQGHAEAQVSLGMMYALGKGVETDLVSAHKWIALSAAQDNREAKLALEQLVGKLTAGQLEQSAELVKQWRVRQSPGTDDPVAQKDKAAPAD